MLVRFKLVETKDWAADKLGQARAGTVAVVVKGVQLAHNTAGRVIGQDRATYLFTSLYLPIEQSPATKPVVQASTAGAKPAPKAAAAAKLTAPKVSELKVGGKITEIKAPM